MDNCIFMIPRERERERERELIDHSPNEYAMTCYFIIRKAVM